MKTLNALLRNRRGATAIEYGLIATGIAIAIIVVLGSVGDQLVVVFNRIVAGLQ